MKAKTTLITGSALMAVGTILGAFGAHALKKILDPIALDTYHTGIYYLQINALGLLFLGLARMREDGPWAKRACFFITMGIALFSGLCVSYAMSGIKVFGILIPIGGFSMILGWSMAALGFIKAKDIK
jgi:uncharacterized membrane protein YgdD (TMEM256/DUF423 family)